MERADGVTGILVQVLARAGGYILVCKDLQVDRVYLWGVRITTRIGLMQTVQRVGVVIGVTDPVKVLLVVLNIGGQVVMATPAAGRLVQSVLPVVPTPLKARVS